jgi:hypothetical protein
MLQAFCPLRRSPPSNVSLPSFMEISAVPVVAAPAAIVLVSVAPELLLPLAVAGVVAIAVVAAVAAVAAGVVVAAATAPPGLAVEPAVVHRREGPQAEVELCHQQPQQPGWEYHPADLRGVSVLESRLSQNGDKQVLGGLWVWPLGRELELTRLILSIVIVSTSA